MRITRDALRELGSCSDYLRAFRDLFPTSQYPDGPEITREVCVAHASTFDWSWAAEKMMTSEGYNEFYRLAYNTYSSEDDFGSPRSNVRSAAVFGHLFETRPDFRSERILRAVQTAVERADDQILSVLTNAQFNNDEAVKQLAYYTEQAPLRAAELAAAEEAAVGARIRKADRRIVTAAEQITAAEARLERARVEAEAAATARGELPAEAPVIETTPTEASEEDEDTRSDNSW